MATTKEKTAISKKETVSKKTVKTDEKTIETVEESQKVTKKVENNSSDSTFAVIFTGGKQYKVKVGDELKIEKILGDHKVGDSLTFDKVLLVDDGKNTKIGNPNVTGASVKAEIKEVGTLPKVTVIHYKQKSKYFKKYGHKQPFFKISITNIKA